MDRQRSSISNEVHLGLQNQVKLSNRMNSVKCLFDPRPNEKRDLKYALGFYIEFVDIGREFASTSGKELLS